MVARMADLKTAIPGGSLQGKFFITAEGKAGSEMPDFARQAAALIPLYKAMVLTRIFDEKAVALQRTGRLGTFASSLGQEAVSVGVASAMRQEDVFLPSFREQGGQLWRGVTPREILLFWGGDERGSDFEGPREDFPVSIPVASHVPHAVGVATAFQLRREPRVAVCIFGDGATSKGDFYEALNMAGIWRVPAVFVINNNQWAISVPRARQTAAQTLAQKAIAAGIPGEGVDGNDVVAVHDAVLRATARARKGDGPTLIEAHTYRLGDHTTADDASRYRDEQDLSEYWKQEPIGRLRKYLIAARAWSKDEEDALQKQCHEQVDHAADDFIREAVQPVSSMFDYLLASMPDNLRSQRNSALSEGEPDHDD